MTDNEALQLKHDDLLICNTKGRYVITNEVTVCRFLRCVKQDEYFCWNDEGPNKTYLWVSPIEGLNSMYKFSVNSFYFDKIHDVPDVSVTDDEIMCLL